MEDELEESNKKSTAKETVHLSWKSWKDWMIEKLGRCWAFQKEDRILKENWEEKRSLLKLDDENSHWLKDFYLELENFNSNFVIICLPLGSEEKDRCHHVDL